MLWDMLWRGSFHHRIMTSVGTMATPARTLQLDNVCTLPAIPAMETAETQTMATMALIDTSCMVQV